MISLAVFHCNGFNIRRKPKGDHNVCVKQCVMKSALKRIRIMKLTQKSKREKLHVSVNNSCRNVSVSIHILLNDCWAYTLLVQAPQRCFLLPDGGWWLKSCNLTSMLKHSHMLLWYIFNRFRYIKQQEHHNISDIK